jgi:hypothetical protein
MANEVRNIVVLKSDKSEELLEKYMSMVPDTSDETQDLCSPLYDELPASTEDIGADWLYTDGWEGNQINLMSDNHIPTEYLLKLFSYLVEFDKDLVIEVESTDESVSVEMTVIRMFEDHINIVTISDYEFFDEIDDDIDPEELGDKQYEIFKEMKGECNEEIEFSRACMYEHPLTLPLNDIN